MDIRSHLEKEIEVLRRKDNKYKVPTDKLLLMAANNLPKLVNEIRYNYYDDFKSEVTRLVDMNILSPIGKHRDEILSYTDFWILPKGKEEYDVELYNHVLDQYSRFDMSYYRLKYNEFKEDKPYIDILHNYYIKNKKERLTSTELGFKLFKDERAFERNDEGIEYKSKLGRARIVIKRLSLSLDNFNAYETNEPLAIQVNRSFYEKDIRKILVIENRDTFYTMAFQKERWQEFDMFILGKGEKICDTFSLASNYDINTTDEIYYFGDIDLIGFYQFAVFRQKYEDYKISLYIDAYRTLLQQIDLSELSNARNGNHYLQIEMISRELRNQFDKELEDKIMNILMNKKYIPQEAIRFSYVEE